MKLNKKANLATDHPIEFIIGIIVLVIATIAILMATPVGRNLIDSIKDLLHGGLV